MIYFLVGTDDYIIVVGILDKIAETNNISVSSVLTLQFAYIYFKREKKLFKKFNKQKFL